MNNTINYENNSATTKWLIIATIMLVAILEVLDSTIVNVALPAMMPSLGADQEQITWVLTSYVVASAMMVPLTGFLSNRLGQRQLLLLNITGFMVSSFCCGLAHSLSTMVIFRLFQGAFGAALIPLSQAILRMSFPLNEQGKAMAIWGLGIMMAPVFGPTLGGYITEYTNWRWIFYLNTPFCFLALLLTYFTVPRSAPKKQKIDFLGIILMFITVGTLQVFLDQGNSKDWFNSNFILLLAWSSLFAGILFIYRNLKQKYPVIKMAIYKERNFTISCIVMALYCGVIFGLITLEPIMLESLFNYDSIAAGITMSPLGLASGIGMVASSQLMRVMPVKILLSAAILFSATGSYCMSTLNLVTDQYHFLLANILIGLGMGCFFVPLATYALAQIAKSDITEASGLFSYARMLGSSIGISLLSTYVSRQMQLHWHELGAHINIFSNSLRVWLQQIHGNLHDPHTLILLKQQLYQQANMQAFLEAFFIIAVVFMLLLPLIWLMKTIKI